MYLLYLIRNEINGKVYIGQTNRSLKRRWTQHLKSDPKLIAQLKVLHKSARGKPLSDAHRLALHLAKKRASKQLWLI